VKTEYFTADDGRFEAVVGRLATRFQDLNGAPLRVLGREDIRAKTAADPHWIKAYLWDFASSDAERIVWIDADIIPRLPIGPLPEADFAAVPYPDGIAMFDYLKTHPEFRVIRHYFNSGFFAARRRLQPAFEAEGQGTSAAGSFFDQSYLNAVIAESGAEIHFLPPEYNWTPVYGPIHDRVIHWHFAGAIKGELPAAWEAWERECAATGGRDSDSSAIR
jgi:hypothetical protein